MKFKRITALIMAFIAVFVFSACSRIKGVPQSASPSVTASPSASEAPASKQKDEKTKIDENGIYDSRDDVALYIHTYGHLPKNYITKKDAEALGWQGGSLSDYAPDKCIGGDRFGNYESRLPKAKNRTYKECDIDTLGKKKRGTKRIIYSNDGLIYYTDNHYKSFTLLYGDEEK